ncbi:dTDP-glucose 4,6-dehydratase [Methanospirillum sp. J.3.6.1-F.2.7.3]|uniref:dTDP-glucose 4,6-dehydratase n=1 Tax=Methanospirillum purgamenti TaxID=2834276 RepID=A0A8E7EK30_9EURY|nr:MULTISPECIES: dTDP-glucose 4,6-dehydratase [Methanospirillum]MDX8549467.1 dTDP-glucose 4,6-dehydratase [Methanospirillum hungatei]QVV89251.1 dTDP-glucose 4,6-dehydratase [Methanospirillum sp. J.3.6.1-F.2.7.3]
MNILVTGVAGFIGSNFVYYYLKKHPEDSLIGFDALTYAGNLDNLTNIPEGEKKRFHFLKGDITDPEQIRVVFNRWNIGGVINFAAESHVDRSIHDPGIFLKTNILGTHSLLEVAKESWCNNGTWDKKNRFLQVSTDEVYGSLGPSGFFSEQTPLDPHSPYSASKAGSDLIVKAYHDTFGLPILITRCSNNYGPYQFPEKLIPLIIYRALNNQSLPIYGDGRQIRDWLYVIDHCSAIDLVFHKGELGEIYNIGGSNEQENIKIVQMILSILRDLTDDQNINDNLITYVRDRPGHDRRYAIDSSKLKLELGWKPKTKFSDGILHTVKWYLNNPEWVNNVISGEYLSFYQNNYRECCKFQSKNK